MLKNTEQELDLVERHILLLTATKENQPIGIMRLSEITELPMHKVRYSLRILEKDGLIEATPDGAVVTELCDDYLKDLSESLATAQKKATKLCKKLKKM